MITVKARSVQDARDQLTDRFEDMQKDICGEDFDVKRVSKKEYEE